jgi:hypothetical protein
VTAAVGLHSNVVLNLTASEAVALAELVDCFLAGAWLVDLQMVDDPATSSAVKKVLAAGDRAQVPWRQR